MNTSKDTLVLVADDEPSTLALVASHVRSKGFDVIEASDGDQAWQMAHEHLPDLIILDVMMPGMSGWEVCRKVREAVSLAHTGVIMLTGIGENLNEMTSPLYGADTYIDKPFEFTDLDAKIEETLSRRRSGALGRPEALDEESVDEGWEEPETMRGANGATKNARRAVSETAGEKAPRARAKAAKAKTKKTAKEPSAPSTPQRKSARRTPMQETRSRAGRARTVSKTPTLPAAPDVRGPTARAARSKAASGARMAAPAKKAAMPKKKSRAASSRGATVRGARRTQSAGVGKSAATRQKAPAGKRTKVKGAVGKTKAAAAAKKKAPSRKKKR